MARTRAVISESNQYWISKERYYELVHFCLQYKDWKHMYNSLDNIQMSKRFDMLPGGNEVSDPTEKIVEAKLYYRNRMEMVEEAAELADIEIKEFIVIGVTEGVSCNYLIMSKGMPCGKDKYYSAYRKFFWHLSKLRR